MFIIKSRQEERGYQYVTLELSTKNYSETEHNDREKFLMRAIKSYYSIEVVLDNENLFDLLAYNFATKQLHFLFLSSKKQEIKDFSEFIRDQYVEWTDNEINFEIITDIFYFLDIRREKFFFRFCIEIYLNIIVEKLVKIMSDKKP